MPYLDLSSINGDLQVVRVPMMSDAEYENAGLIWNRAAIGFKGTEAQNQAVADFVEYFIGRNSEWVQAVSANSPYTAVLEDESYQEFLASNPALQALEDQLQVSFIAPVFAGSTEMRNQLEELSKLPSYETLLTQLAAGMLGTVRNLAVALNLYVEEHEEAAN